MGYIKIQELVKTYLPVLYQFVDLSQSDWDEINTRSDKRLEFLETEIDLYGKYKYEANLFDVCINLEKCTSAKYFTLFFEKIIKDIKELVPPKFFPKIKDRAYDIIGNFDKDRSNYRDAIGEFVALNSLIRNSRFILVEIESKLENGKRIDYEFIDTKDDAKLLIDVLNIDFKVGKIKTKGDLVKFLSKRIVDKFNKKLNNIDRDDIPKNFTLLPVVWCEIEEVKEMLSVFSDVEAKFNILPFYVITQSKNFDGSYNYHFLNVAELNS